LRQLFRDPHFVFGELIFIILCGAVWLTRPQWGIWFILIALAVFLLKVFTGNLKFISLDWLILVFVTTAWVGYWAAYDQTTAWAKLWFIVSGVLLFYSLRVQPNENLIRISVLLFCAGIGVSLYYFLTYDFISAPRRIELVNRLGRWFMEIRPQTGWTPIHPNYMAGLAAITAPFILYPIWKIRNDGKAPTVRFYVFVVAGLGVVGLALFMATSRGVILAIVSGVGAWLLWRLTQAEEIKRRLKSEAAFPILLVVYLCIVVAFLYTGPAQLGGAISNSNFYGTGSRAELFTRSLYLVLDYPITGGGLGTFPGLYSHYLLGVPFFYLPNSHNLFLDVTIEQGLLGGLSFLIVYITAIWMAASSIANKGGNHIFKWIALFSLIVAVIQGMVDNYLYNGAGAILSLFPLGLALNGEGQENVLNSRRLNFKYIGVAILMGLMIGLIYLNQIRSIWYANLGSVQMARVELEDFPNNGWVGNEIVPELDEAKKTLHSALRLDPQNRTANQRLGMIAMHRMDFDSAVDFFEASYAEAPDHRGVIKSLGYGYLWSDNLQMAQEFFVYIPEVSQELSVYTWWWKVQGQDDLSEKAELVLGLIGQQFHSPERMNGK
jgi:O-antigen ligase